MKSLPMRMDYQLPPPPPQTLQIGPSQVQVQQTHLQILQNVHQQHQQQQQQQQLQQQQQQIVGTMQPPATLPPLSSLPLQVVHNLPHLLGNTNVVNTTNNVANTNPTTNNNNTNLRNNNGNNTLQPLNGLVGGLPPSSQLLHHHLQHLANANNNNNNNNPNTPNNNTTTNNNNLITNNNNNNNGGNVADENNRWTQFQVQQLWKHHASYLNGKSGNSKEICGDDKFKEDGDPWNVEAQAAFLGPNLWDKTLPYDADLKYADLDEFLSENNIPDGLPGTHLGHSTGLGHRSDSLGHSTGLSLGLGHITTKRERSPSPSDCISPDTLNPPSPAESIFDISAFSFASSGRDFDPRTRAFSDEELKPQPMIKKSRKQFVPDELKDDKYWARRRKNNIAAKRSRDARRQKENQIAMRARYLEKENSTLHQEVEQLKQENMDLRARLSKFQDV
ncbi:GATA zinc finger domain-containing protein 13 isoform X13 [Episyrphus balteatus]|uniref:GATA zinc finger domain-containing protein 13 isoform X13 n=1 Tax=Episyrphus balteatus TaxID=286459 RepID=UPI002484DEBD|nr:GATA zinc finger domain-containing protein 13 isoform X13 [Episyrphus balteatus]